MVLTLNDPEASRGDNWQNIGFGMQISLKPWIMLSSPYRLNERLIPNMTEYRYFEKGVRPGREWTASVWSNRPPRSSSSDNSWYFGVAIARISLTSLNVRLQSNGKYWGVWLVKYLWTAFQEHASTLLTHESCGRKSSDNSLLSPKHDGSGLSRGHCMCWSRLLQCVQLRGRYSVDDIRMSNIFEQSPIGWLVLALGRFAYAWSSWLSSRIPGMKMRKGITRTQETSKNRWLLLSKLDSTKPLPPKLQKRKERKTKKILHFHSFTTDSLGVVSTSRW